MMRQAVRIVAVLLVLVYFILLYAVSIQGDTRCKYNLPVFHPGNIRVKKILNVIPSVPSLRMYGKKRNGNR